MHSDDDDLYFEEEIKRRRIHTYIICTDFPAPSRLPVPDTLKLTAKTAQVITRCRDILDVLVLRFDPPYSLYQKAEQDLSALTDEATLKKLLAAAVQSEDISAFLNVMQKRP
ncbi:MAG: hypothetical protein GY862_34880 [Gammaproteobacteria bacterium]|nr:hypothetical protein [Gammaproteobacteria bacterium]